MSFRLVFDRPVDDETYVELVRSLSLTVVNTALFGILFSAVAAWTMVTIADPVVLGTGCLGVLLAVARVVAVFGLRARVAGRELTAAQARQAECRFGPVYLAFAAFLGLFAGHAFLAGPLELQLLATALVVGFASGVATGLSLRPWISVPAIVLAVVPVISACLFRGGAHYLLLGLVLATLLAGGAGSMLARYRSETEKIGMRRLLGTLARQDHLTGLANRLALSDAYAVSKARNGPEKVAVHCLDLDGFKKVNDVYGHPAGDALLQVVAARLKAIVRKSDVAARLGGDEFVVLQTGINHPSEAELMARRFVRTLRELYVIDGHQLNVDVSVGYALSSSGGGEDLATLLERADQALYKVKRLGGGAACGFPEREDNVVRLTG